MFTTEHVTCLTFITLRVYTNIKCVERSFPLNGFLGNFNTIVFSPNLIIVMYHLYK